MDQRIIKNFDNALLSQIHKITPRNHDLKQKTCRCAAEADRYYTKLKT